MLFAPPPGYSPAAINRQTVNSQAVPGQQGGMAQGYFNNPYRSSYLPPSSYSVPSSIAAPSPWYQGNKSMNSQNAMAKALQGVA